jgi:hypothetical protein
LKHKSRHRQRKAPRGRRAIVAMQFATVSCCTPLGWRLCTRKNRIPS